MSITINRKITFIIIANLVIISLVYLSNGASFLFGFALFQMLYILLYLFCIYTAWKSEGNRYIYLIAGVVGFALLYFNQQLNAMAVGYTDYVAGYEPEIPFWFEIVASLVAVLMWSLPLSILIALKKNTPS